jgi:hypothetical protein
VLHPPSPPVRAAAERARWLAELASALDHAGRLLWRMSENESGSREAVALAAKVAALRREVDLIQRGRSTPIGTINPYRMN